MSKITLKTLFDEIRKIDVKGDVRFEFLKEQIQKNHAELKSDLSIIRDQTAHITERVTVLEHREKSSSL